MVSWDFKLHCCNRSNKTKKGSVVHFYYYNTVYSVWYVTPRPAAVRNSCCCVNQVSQKKKKTTLLCQITLIRLCWKPICRLLPNCNHILQGSSFVLCAICFPFRHSKK